MKFGQQLRSSIIREYQWYYIDYDLLKAELKSASGPPIPTEEDDNEAGPSNTSNGKKTAATSKQKNRWTEEDEQKFIGKLYAELDKVYTKTKVKESEIQRRIAVSEREVREVVSKATERGLNEQGPPEEDFILLEGDLSDIIADVHDLAKYVQLNYTGFYKIIKKHDVCAPCLSTKPVRKSKLTLVIENNVLVPTTILRCRTKEETVLQRRLRRRSGKTFKFIQQRPDKGEPGEGR